MKHHVLEVPVTVKPGSEAAVTALHAQRDGTLLCGLCFASPSLLRLKPSGDGASFVDTYDFDAESFGGSGYVGVTGGLRATETGGTVVALWHEGLLPGFLSSLLGKVAAKVPGAALKKFFRSQSGGMGLFARHSVVQVEGENLVGRRFKEPGVLLDAARIGDFCFGLTGKAVWKEPFLNTEKRETLRSDLVGNDYLHRDDTGYFWLLTQNGRLGRLKHTDHRVLPTPVKFPDAEGPFTTSCASPIGEWLYAFSEPSKTLIRVRRNPVSNEEQHQKVHVFSAPVGAMAVADRGEKKPPLLVACVNAPGGVEVWGAELSAPADSEETGDVPVFTKLHTVPEMKAVSSLTADSSGRLWAGEGDLGSKGTLTPRILCLSGF